TYVLTHLLSGEAAYIISGAMLGTVMAFNVALNIMPNQRKMYAAQNVGGFIDPNWSHDAKHRSTHNNYLTLPVLFAMISNHYAMTYGDEYRWVVLIVLVFVGFGVDYFLNTRDRAHKNLGYLAVAGAFAGVIVMGFVTSMPATPVAEAATAAPTTPVAFSTVHQIIHERCQVCHSAHPTSTMFTSAPMGIEFDTPQEIKAHAALIDQMAIKTHAMPLGNITKMTAAERQTLGAWLAQGANIEAGAGK
ncbi:MAG TPA: urate hydroxylase PuuD, partial [Nevskiaceae bacterium]|nr:urate hydroxylase PuuD [Nevskiaceae bacterium]